MRSRRLRRSAWAVWLGVAALFLNAMVPVHLAFDLAEALGAAPSNDPGWALLAKLSGHPAPADDDHDSGHHHHHPPCPVCSAFGALGGLAPAAPPRLLLPPTPSGAPAVLQSEERLDGSALAAYRSRAPPTA